jgi:hypothetical protein
MQQELVLSNNRVLFARNVYSVWSNKPITFGIAASC